MKKWEKKHIFGQFLKGGTGTKQSGTGTICVLSTGTGTGTHYSLLDQFLYFGYNLVIYYFIWVIQVAG